MATSSPEPAPNLTPWLSIWWKPQATIRAVLQRPGKSYALLLVAVAGVGWMIDIAHPVLHWFTVIVGAALLGPVFAILGLFLYGALLAWTGRPLGGIGSQNALRMGLAWAAMPNAVAALVLVGAIVFFGQDFVRAYASTTDSGNLLFEGIVAIAAVPRSEVMRETHPCRIRSPHFPPGSPDRSISSGGYDHEASPIRFAYRGLCLARIRSGFEPRRAAGRLR